MDMQHTTAAHDSRISDTSHALARTSGKPVWMGIALMALATSCMRAEASPDNQPDMEEEMQTPGTPAEVVEGSITYELYDSFQRGELSRWDAIIAEDVEIFSPGAWGLRGRDNLKVWAGAFLEALKPRIDLVDEFDGGERAFITVNLNWKHVAPFFDLPPTGREGTSIETFILTIQDGKIVRFGVADNSLDLAIYLWERGWPQQHNVHPTPIIQGIERR